MSSLDIDIILKSDDFILVTIYINGIEEWKKEYSKETQIYTIFDDYKIEKKSDLPKDINDILKVKRNKDVINDEDLLLNNITGYEESDLTFNQFNDTEISEIIGKPFNNPFNVFRYIKKEKALKLLKFEENMNLDELKDYSPNSSYCNGDNKLFISGGEKNNGENVEKFWIIDLETAEIESYNMIPKKNHSMVKIPGNYVFIVGGQSKETFLFDIENKKFFGWKKLNKQRIEPALILVDNYLYCFDNTNSYINEKFTFERTDLNSGEHNWEIVEPNISSMKMNQKYFGVVKNNDDIIFLGGNLDIENRELLMDKISERKNLKYNISNNTIEESNIKFVEYNFKEKTFLKYSEKLSYILPDFNRYHPEVMFFHKEKNEIKFLKCYSKKKLEEKEKEKEEKNLRDMSPFKILLKGLKLNLNQPKEPNLNEENTNTKLAKEFIKDEEIQNINENINKSDNEEYKNENDQYQYENIEQNKLNEEQNDQINEQNILNEEQIKENNEQNILYEEPNEQINEQNKLNEEQKKENNEQNILNEEPNKENNEQNILNEEPNVQNIQIEEKNEQINEQNILNKEQNEQNDEQNKLNEKQNEQNEENNEQNIQMEEQIIENANIIPKDDNEDPSLNNEINNDVDTNNLQLLDNILKHSTPMQQGNVEINITENKVDSQVKISPSENINKSGKEGIQISNDIKPINNEEKINMDINPSSNQIEGKDIDLTKTVQPTIYINKNENDKNAFEAKEPKQQEINGGIASSMPVNNLNNNEYFYFDNSIILGTNDNQKNFPNASFMGKIGYLNTPNPNVGINSTNNNPNTNTNLYIQDPNINNTNIMMNEPNKNMIINETNMNTNLKSQDPNINTNLNVQDPNINTNLNVQDPNMNTNLNVQDPNMNTNLNVQDPNMNNPNFVVNDPHMNNQGKSIDINNNNINQQFNTSPANDNLNSQMPNIDMNAQDDQFTFHIEGIILGTKETNSEIIKLKKTMDQKMNANISVGVNYQMQNQGDINTAGNMNMNSQIPYNQVDPNNNNQGISNNQNNLISNYPNMSGVYNVKINEPVNLPENTNENVAMNTGNNDVHINMNENISGINPQAQKSDINGNMTGTNLNIENQAQGGDISFKGTNVNINTNNNNFLELLETYDTKILLDKNKDIKVPSVNITSNKIEGNYNGDINAVIPNNFDPNQNIQPVQINFDGNQQNMNMGTTENNFYDKDGNFYVTGIIQPKNERNINDDINNMTQSNLLLLQSNQFDTKYNQSRINTNMNQSGIVSNQFNTEINANIGTNNVGNIGLNIVEEEKKE